MSEVLTKALLAFQKEAPELHKTSEGQIGSRKYKYLGLDEAMAKIRPLLNEHGIVVTQKLGHENGDRLLVTELHHAHSADFLASVLRLPDTDDMQALGSAISYARRYSLIALLGLVADEDDDGSKAIAKPKEQAAKPSATEQKAEQGQIKQLTGLLEALERGHPLPDPNYNWTTEAQAFCTETFNKTSVTLLSKAEMNQLLEEFEKRLHEHEEQPF